MRSSVFAVLLLAACTPKNVPRCTCTNELLALGDPWSCTLSAERLDGPSRLEFSTESRNLMADVKLAFTVKEGALTIGWADGSAVVKPDAPLSLELKVPMRKPSRAFSLSFAPEPVAVGLAGTVNYATP